MAIVKMLKEIGERAEMLLHRSIDLSDSTHDVDLTTADS